MNVLRTRVRVAAVVPVKMLLHSTTASVVMAMFCSLRMEPWIGSLLQEKQDSDKAMCITLITPVFVSLFLYLKINKLFNTICE